VHLGVAPALAGVVLVEAGEIAVIALVYQLKADTTVESKTVLEHDIDHKV
jgi:hypothetical protein